MQDAVLATTCLNSLWSSVLDALNVLPERGAYGCFGIVAGDLMPRSAPMGMGLGSSSMKMRSNTIGLLLVVCRVFDIDLGSLCLP